MLARMTRPGHVRASAGGMASAGMLLDIHAVAGPALLPLKDSYLYCLLQLAIE